MKPFMKTVIPLGVFVFSGTAAFFLLPPPPKLPSGFTAGSSPGSLISLAEPFGSSGSTASSFGSAPASVKLSLQPNPIGTNTAESPSGPPGFQTFNPLQQDIYFKDLADGFDELDSNLGNMKTIPNSNQRNCFKTCLEDEGCAMVVLCKPNQEPVNTNPNGGSPLSGLQMFLPRKKSSNHDCHVFYKVDSSPSFSQEEKAQLGSECQYIYYNPKCRSPVLQPGWQKYQEVTMTSEQTLIQKYTCMTGYTKTQGEFNEITCDKYGNEISIGGCTPGGSHGTSQALLPSLGGNNLNPNVAPRPDIDECLDGNPCTDIPNSACENSQGGFECLCHDGFTKVDNVCVDIDECQVGSPCTVIPNSDCENSQGGFECLCHDGFTKVDNVCVDIDECLIGSPCSDIANSDCENSQSGFECLCHDGFTKVDNVCVDTDECLDGSPCVDISNSDCVNTQGKYECHCHEGFAKVDNTCVDVDECLTEDICSTGHVCTNTDGSYECSGQLATLPTTQPPTAPETQPSCSNNEYFKFETDKCECVAGYERLSYGSSCTDVNECEPVSPCPVGYVCTNNVGDYECSVFENPAETCEARGFTYNAASNLCFKYINNSQTEEKAKEICELEYGARLAILNTYPKIEAVDNYFKSAGITAGIFLWVGAEQEYDYFLHHLHTNSYLLQGKYYFHEYWTFEEGVTWSDSSHVAQYLFFGTPQDNYRRCTELNSIYDFRLTEWYCEFSQPFVCDIPVKNCPEPFKYDEESHFCYKFESEVADSELEAWNRCDAIPDARLAITHTQRKIDVVQAAADATTRHVDDDGNYLPIVVAGSYYFFDDWEEDEVDMWLDNSIIRKDLFKTGQPNFDDGNCVAIDGNKLKNVHCSVMFEYVCEIPQ